MSRSTSFRLSRDAKQALKRAAAAAKMNHTQYIESLLRTAPAPADIKCSMRMLSERLTRAARRPGPSARRTALRSLVATAQTLGEVSRSAIDEEHRSELRLAAYLILQLLTLLGRQPAANGGG